MSVKLLIPVGTYHVDSQDHLDLLRLKFSTSDFIVKIEEFEGIEGHQGKKWNVYVWKLGRSLTS